MIKQHSEDAAHQADVCASALIERDDSASGAVWRGIREAIDELQNNTQNGLAH
jgi:hypothetical protein